MSKMNPEVKAKWLAALRSGEYTQGTGWLNTNGKYCCLGVLCEIAEREGVVTADSTRSYNGRGVVGYYDLPEEGRDPLLNTTLLSHGVMEWAGLGHTDGRFEEFSDETEDLLRDSGFLAVADESETCASLADMNDYGLTFEQIADVIEREF